MKNLEYRQKLTSIDKLAYIYPNSKYILSKTELKTKLHEDIVLMGYKETIILTFLLNYITNEYFRVSSCKLVHYHIILFFRMLYLYSEIKITTIIWK